MNEQGRQVRSERSSQWAIQLLGIQLFKMPILRDNSKKEKNRCSYAHEKKGCGDYRKKCVYCRLSTWISISVSLYSFSSCLILIAKTGESFWHVALGSHRRSYSCELKVSCTWIVGQNWILLLRDLLNEVTSVARLDADVAGFKRGESCRGKGASGVGRRSSDWSSLSGLILDWRWEADDRDLGGSVTARWCCMCSFHKEFIS